MKKQFAIAMVVIMLVSVLTVTLTCLPTIVSATPWTPVEWQDDGKLKNWVRDQNENFVDDLIEAQTGKVDIIVDLNGCIGEPANSEIVKYLNTLGDVVYVGKYVSFIIVKGVEGDRCVDIANRPEVAMVELATTDKWLGDNFRASKVETSAKYHPNTLQDAFGWPAVRNGNGINIAFLDTGANPTYDPYVTHGYDAINNVEINPGHDLGFDHASWMASWVFGLGGIAPQAGLVDIKVGDVLGVDSAAEMRALEKVYEKQRDWGINVVVMMHGGSASLDGREARQQLIDLLSGQGIVVVAATGANTNDAPVTGPGAATRAIGVSAANIMNTVDRGDDVAPYVRGPRMDDGDMDLLDELKPEVIMPTGESDTLVSNSIATAMTSGLVALILESHLGLRNFDNKASGSVKDLLIRSAEPKGTADTTVEYPHPTPTWDQYWGFGEIDAFEAFRYLSDQEVTGRTDLTFKGFDGTSHPSPTWYYSHAVETQSERDGRNIEAGVPDRIFARVYNNGSQDAHNVRVSFGFYPFTAGIPKFYDIGSVVIDIGRFSDESVSIDWTPPTLPAGEDHGCILVTIDYGLDSKFSGGSNFAQKNVQVQPASSPAVFTFRVENPLPTRARIELKVMTEHKDWTITLSETSFTMEPYECARTVQATVEPSARVKPGTEALLFVTAYATAMGQEKGVEIGGVALKALGPTPPPGKSDLVIKDIKLTKMDGYCYVDYLISNTGTVSALASTAYLYVDGKKVASDSTSALAPGASRWDRFTAYRTTGTHTYKVCADGSNAISESNEANNCRTEKLTCPEAKKPDLAYIYSTDTSSANSYKSLLDANGYSTTLIPMSDVATTDFSKYDAIITGSDTGSMSSWGDSASVSAVKDSYKPIIGLGEGGYALFGQLKLDTGHPQGWHGDKNSIYVVDTSHTIFKTPNAIVIPKSKIIRLYTSTQHVGIYLPAIPSNIAVLGREVESTSHYPLTLERNKYLLWGFTASPVGMTGVGKDLFINVVSYMTD